MLAEPPPAEENVGAPRRCALPWASVAFIADILDRGNSALPVARRHDLDKTDEKTLKEVLSALDEIGVNVRHFDSPEELSRHADELRGALVFSTYAGSRSRNRLILVPAVAESLGLDFVGLDAMGQALAHDKEVMKRIAQDCGLETPRWRVIRERSDLRICGEFPMPYVLKPLAEGSSVGIGPQNLVKDASRGVEIAAELLEHFHQPILIEAFVGGREVSYVSIEAAPAPYQCFVEVVVSEQPHYFDDHLFDAGEKLNRNLNRAIHPIDHMLRLEDQGKRCFQATALSDCDAT